MNKIIEKQLSKLMIAVPSEFDKDKHQYTFKKVHDTKVEEDKFYLIRIGKTLLSDFVSDSLVYNLNKGTFPTHTYMKVNVLKVDKGLIQVNGHYFDEISGQDIQEFWSGWLPKSHIEIIQEL